MLISKSLFKLCVGFAAFILISSTFASEGLRQSRDTIRSLNGISVAVSRGVTFVEASSDGLTLFFNDRKTKEALFVSAPKPGFDEKPLVEELIKNGLGVLLPKESQTFAWKQGDGVKRVSKFEIDNGNRNGFNRTVMVGIEYRHVLFNHKDLIVGHVYDFALANKANERFNGPGITVSMPACNTSVRVIHSFTKEKPDMNEPPCELISIAP